MISMLRASLILSSTMLLTVSAVSRPYENATQATCADGTVYILTTVAAIDEIRSIVAQTSYSFFAFTCIHEADGNKICSGQSPRGKSSEFLGRSTCDLVFDLYTFGTRKCKHKPDEFCRDKVRSITKQFPLDTVTYGVPSCTLDLDKFQITEVPDFSEYVNRLETFCKGCELPSATDELIAVPKPETVRINNVTKERYEANTQVKFSCETSDGEVRAITSTCKRDGTWDNAPPAGFCAVTTTSTPVTEGTNGFPVTIDEPDTGGNWCPMKKGVDISESSQKESKGKSGDSGWLALAIPVMVATLIGIGN